MPKWDVLAPHRPQSRPLADIRDTPTLANVNFLLDDLGVSGPSAMFTVWVAMDVTGIFRVIYFDGPLFVILDINGGKALVANALYAFDIPLHAAPLGVDMVNFQYSVDAGILLFRVDETVLDRGTISALALAAGGMWL